MSDTMLTKLEDAIERLTNISSDLNKLIAVHEQRLNQQEKQMTSFETVLEKRREEADIKLRDVYETIRSEDKNILNELNQMRTESMQQYEKLNSRLSEMEKKIWLYIGGFSIIAFMISYGQPLMKFLTVTVK